MCPEARPPSPHPQLCLVHKSWTVTRQRDRDESACCHDNLVVAGTQGRGLAVCLSPGIWTTSEHQPGWPRSSQGSPSRAGHTMTTSPPPQQHLLPGPPWWPHYPAPAIPPHTTPAPQPRRPPQGNPCSSSGPAACFEGQPRGAVEPGEVAGENPSPEQRFQLPRQLCLARSMCAP